MTTVLVTGGAGFIGSNIIDHLLALNSRIEIFVLDNLKNSVLSLTKNFNSSGVYTLVAEDLMETDLSFLPKNKDLFVLHLAANSDISIGALNPDIDFNNTVSATYSLLKRLRDYQVRGLLYTSGTGVYGDQRGVETSEDFGPLLPVSIYGASKLSAESLIFAFSHLYGFPVTVLRLANVVGRWQTHGVIYDFIRKLKNNPKELEILGNGLQCKPYIHVSQVVEAVSSFIYGTIQLPKILNLSAPDRITVNEIAEIVIKGLGLEGVKVSRGLSDVGWPGDVPQVGINDSQSRDLGLGPRLTSKEAVVKAVNELLSDPRSIDRSC